MLGDKSADAFWRKIFFQNLIIKRGDFEENGRQIIDKVK
jgi:hypothetical protein